MLLVTSCWVSCDGLVSHLWGGGGGGVIILLVTSCWESCDGLAFHPGGGGGGGSNTPSHEPHAIEPGEAVDMSALCVLCATLPTHGICIILIHFIISIISPQAALDWFAMKRFYDDSLGGVTQPSQRRSAKMFKAGY